MQDRNATGADWPSIQITAAPPSDTLARPTVRVRCGSPPVRPVLDQRWRWVLSVPGLDQLRRRHRSDVADLLVDLGAVNGDVVRGGDAEAHLVALAAQDRDGDVVADMQGLAGSAGQDQHGVTPFEGFREQPIYLGSQW